MISVVVPAYNEEKEINRCLESLVHQETEKEFEVVLVNNASTDTTQEVAKGFLQKLSLTILFEPQKGRGKARATGFNSARGEIILSTDADTAVPTDWVEKLVDGLEKSQAVAVAGSMTVTGCGKVATATFNLVQPLTARLYRVLFGHYWLGGYNFAIYKDVYQRSGGFNTNLNAMEDTDLGFRVRKIGKISFLPKVVVKFSGRRFENRFIPGLLDYVVQFFKYYFGKEKKTYLSDIR